MVLVMFVDSQYLRLLESEILTGEVSSQSKTNCSS